MNSVNKEHCVSGCQSKLRIRLTKQATNSVDKASCVSGRVLRLLIRPTLEAANPVNLKAANPVNLKAANLVNLKAANPINLKAANSVETSGIDNEAASSMTRVAEDDETQSPLAGNNSQGSSTANNEGWHYGNDHGNAVEDRQYEVDFAIGITGIFCCKSGRSCAGAEAIQSNELLSTK
ncbi:hypothetical protein Tco_0621006, partial [Tanacetum coccineum]